MKAARVTLALVILIFMFGCAQTTWQAKGTAVYVGAGDGLKAADDAFQALKKQGSVTTEQIAQYDKSYKIAYDAYVAAGDAWKLALRAGSDIEKGKYLEAFYKNFADFQKLATDVIIFVNGILAKK